MIILENFHPIIKNIISSRFQNEGNKEIIDVKFSDFSKLFYHIVSTEEDAKKLKVEVNVPFLESIYPFGIEEHLKKTYESILVKSSCETKLCFEIDTNNSASKDAVSAIHLIKHHVYSGLINYFANKLTNQSNKNDKIQFCYDGRNYLNMATSKDGLTVFHSISFQNEDDILFGKIFLQEFKEGTKKAFNSPSIVVFFKEPPSEIASSEINSGPKVGYIGMTFTSRHLNESSRSKVVDVVSSLPNYLDYAIKATKGYIQRRITNKAEEFVKEINKSKKQNKVEKKTFSGKTFNKA